MHILQLANFYGPRTGGLRVVVDELARHYVERGHRCTLVVPGERDDVRHADGRTLVAIRSPFVPGLGGYRAIVDRRAAIAAVDRARPDVVELSDKTTLVPVAGHARRAGAPIALFSHERTDGVVGEVVSGRPVVARAIGSYNGRLARRVDAVVCASRYAAEEFERFETPICRVPLGTDLTTFRPRPRPAGSAGGRRLRLVAVVRLSPEKRPDLLLTTSVALLRRGIDHELVVIGDGPLRDRLTEHATHLPIEFRGHVGGRAELAAELAVADVGIAPGPHETFGLGALEMLACGTPLVVPDHGALPELIDRTDVGLAAPRNGEAFAAAIVQLVDGDRAARRVRARRLAEGYTWERAGDAMLDVLERLVAAGGVEVPDRSTRYDDALAAARSNL